MDVRWLYWEGETKLLDEKRSEYMPQVFEGNLFLSACAVNRKEFNPPLVVGAVASLHLIERGANLFPMHLREHHEEGTLYAADERPNLSEAALARLAALGENRAEGPSLSSLLNTSLKAEGTGMQGIKADEDADTPGSDPCSLPDPTDLFFHALAILHAPAYRCENAGALRMDWPRIPWPASRPSLSRSAALGRRVAALLDVEQGVPGVTMGKIQEALKPVGSLITADGGPLDPAVDFEVTAGWAIRGQGGIAMPSEGDRVFLNDRACWAGISDEVWQYSLGGYQVLKKWLSYRESALLGRALRTEEVDHFSQMARRIAGLLAMGDALDANYREAADVRG